MGEPDPRPGRLVAEQPAGTPAVVGVGTSVAAFVGAAARGPAGVAVELTGFGDYARHLGGTGPPFPLDDAVAAFFANGGNRAVALRLVGIGARTARTRIDGLRLAAASPGRWANDYRVTTTTDPDDPRRFDLGIAHVAHGTLETFTGLTLDRGDPRFAVDALRASALVRAAVGVPATPVVARTMPLRGGADGTAPVVDSAAVARALAAVEFNLLNAPGLADAAALARLARLCRDRRAVLIIDSDTGVPPPMAAADAANAALYYPWLLVADPLQPGQTRAVPPGGAVAGVIARTDIARGVWNAPAGADARLAVAGTRAQITDAENGALNGNGVNCLRSFPGCGTLVWGARTLAGSNAAASEWKYLPVRRVALFIEESLSRGLQWTIFEPNDEPCRAQARQAAANFLIALFRQGAFHGATPAEAFFVRCDRSTTTEADTAAGVVTLLVGFAALKAGEFIVLQIRLRTSGGG